MSVLVGRKAPDFTAAAVMGDGSINESFKLSDLRGHYVALFFYPMDFTFVCPTEILAHDHRRKAFEKLGVQLIAVSTDSQFTHFAWRSTPVNKGGIGPVGFPMVADVKREIMRAYDVEHPEAGVALRGTFLIDKQGIVQHQTVNNLPLGRNVDELLRMVEALQFFEKNGEVCPAGWQHGEAGMKASTKGVAEYLTEHAEAL
ncbi:MAG: peroxiredoxin [Nevskiaceae bacterium]|nr:MAG: peroxiredoxin [Nevskiaceae bacterium]TBR72209.1 MAG: peroxiredoxin [Nevskiaceae bacterium]